MVIIAKNFNISVYKFNRQSSNYLYHACVNIHASGEENVHANQLVYSVADNVRLEQDVILVKK